MCIQGRAVLEGVLARELPGVLGALRVPSLRSAVEVALRQLVATFYLRSAVPSLKVRAAVWPANQTCYFIRSKPDLGLGT